MKKPTETIAVDPPKIKVTDNLDAYSIEEFCRRHSISRGTYYNLKEKNEGPVEGHVLGRVLITKEAALDWRKKINAT